MPVLFRTGDGEGHGKKMMNSKNGDSGSSVRMTFTHIAIVRRKEMMKEMLHTEKDKIVEESKSSI